MPKHTEAIRKKMTGEKIFEGKNVRLVIRIHYTRLNATEVNLPSRSIWSCDTSTPLMFGRYRTRSV